MGALLASLSSFQTIVQTPQRQVSARKRKVVRTDSQSLQLPSSKKTEGREEWALVQQATAGDSRSKEQIFTSHTSMLHRIALSILGNNEDAEDAVQDALCRAYTRLRSFEGRSTFSTWLTRIVINSALMSRRRRNSRLETSLEEIFNGQSERWSPITDVWPNPEEIYRINEIHGILAEQIRQLPPHLREALQLSDLDGLSTADSSQVLGIRQSTFKSRISRARQKLAKRLQQSFQMPKSTLPQGTTEISSSEIVFSSQSRTNQSPALGRTTCQ